MKQPAGESLGAIVLTNLAPFGPRAAVAGACIKEYMDVTNADVGSLAAPALRS